MRTGYFSIILLVITIIITSCTSTDVSPQAIVTLESVPAGYAGKTNPLGAGAATDGAKIFQGYCESCHGPQGHGDGPAGQSLDPKPKNLADLHSNAGDDYLFWRINTGKPGTSMIGWEGVLTEDQIWQVIAFIRIMK